MVLIGLAFATGGSDGRLRVAAKKLATAGATAGAAAITTTDGTPKGMYTTSVSVRALPVSQGREILIISFKLNLKLQGKWLEALLVRGLHSLIPASFFRRCGPTQDDWTSLFSNSYSGNYEEDSLGFIFTFYGKQYTLLVIDQSGSFTALNGNCSLLFSPFSSSAGTITVDARGGNGQVWAKFDNNKFAVAWDHVGYNNEHGDKRNTFQMLISEGTDVAMGIGNTICLCYEDMNWTAGDVC